MLMVVASPALLAACVAPVQQTESTAPTVSYTYQDEGDYELVAKRADLHCEEYYGQDATLTDRDVESTGYEATFRCE
jgi:hypothetical protein